MELKKDVKDYIITGSFARGVLLTGVVVGTGTNNAASPEPIMIRLVDTAIFSKGYNGANQRSNFNWFMHWGYFIREG